MNKVKQMLAFMQREFANLDQEISHLPDDTKNRHEIVTASEGISNALLELECALDGSEEEEEGGEEG